MLSTNQVVLGTVYAISVNVEGHLGDTFGLRTVTIVGAAISLLVLLVLRVTRPGITAVLDTPSALSAQVSVPTD